MRDRLTRFAPLVGIGTMLAAWLVAFNLSFAALNDTRLLAWIPDRTSGIGYLLESRQRVQSAEALYGSSRQEAARPLVAVVGISDVREGTRLEILSEANGDRVRFLGIAGAGAGFGSVKEQASLLLNSNLRPELVLLGISPMQMIEVQDFEQGAAKAAADGESDIVGRAKSELRRSLWFVQRRSDLVGWLDRILLEERGDIEEALGQQPAVDPRSPWRPLLRTLGVEHYPDKVLQESLAVVRASGAGETGVYQRSRQPFVEAGSLIRQLQARGSTVVVMFMPRHPWLEAALPASVDDLIGLRLRKAAGDPALRILDYSKAVPAGGFIDLVHLNTEGGSKFSRLLAADLLMQNQVRRQDGIAKEGSVPLGQPETKNPAP